MPNLPQRTSGNTRDDHLADHNTLHAEHNIAKIPLSQRGTANGVATLDAGGLVPLSQLPDDLASRGATLEAYSLYVAGGVYTAYDPAGAVVSEGTRFLTVYNAIRGSNRRIIFGAGTFDLAADNLDHSELNDFVLEGQGMGVTILRNDTGAVNDDTEPLSFTRCNRVTVRDMTVLALGSQRADGGLTSDAIDFDAGSECLVERVKTKCTRGRGIVFDGKDIRSGTTTTGTTGTTVITTTNVFYPESVGRTIVVGTFTGTIATYVSATRVTTNTAHGQGTGVAVTVHSVADYNVIRDCVVYECLSDGIEFLAASHSQVIGTICYGNGGHGVHINKGSPTSGQPNKKAQYCSVIGGRFHKNGHTGVSITSCDYNSIIGAACIGNGTVLARDGIRVTTFQNISANANTLIGNVCTDDKTAKTQVYGIRILPVDTGVVTDTVITGNILTGNLTGALSDAGTGTLKRNNVGVTEPTSTTAFPSHIPLIATGTAQVWTTPTAFGTTLTEMGSQTRFRTRQDLSNATEIRFVVKLGTGATPGTGSRIAPQWSTDGSNWKNFDNSAGTTVPALNVAGSTTLEVGSDVVVSPWVVLDPAAKQDVHIRAVGIADTTPATLPTLANVALQVR